MVSTAFVTAAAVLTAAACVTHTEAHGYVAKPPVEFKSGTQYPSQWVKEFGPPWSGTFKTGAQYAAAAKQKGYKNLRAFLESYGPVCGNTNAKAKARPIPSDKKVVFSRAIVHPGPCELWLDNTLVYHNDDCEKTFGSATPVFPINWSSCSGDCVLRFYWLGLQDSGKRWQSYKNCVPVTTNKARSFDDEEELSEPTWSTGEEAEDVPDWDANVGIDSVDADLFNEDQASSDDVPSYDDNEAGELNYDGNSNATYTFDD